MSEQSLEQLSQTYYPIHLSNPCSPYQDEPSSLTNLNITYVLEMTNATLGE